MVAEFGDVIRAGRAWRYRRLFWEAGVLGQALYLGAEAAGVGAFHAHAVVAKGRVRFEG